MEIYRFHGMVAISPPKGLTFYLTADEADALATALDNFAGEIRGDASFRNSELPPVKIDASGERRIIFR